MDENSTPPSRRAVDRRAALKKAAAAAGVVAWATPTVQALTPGVASAQTLVTNCGPTGNIDLVPTGDSCGNVPTLLGGPELGGAANCCNGQTVFVVKGSIGCGASCGGAAGGTITDYTVTAVNTRNCGGAYAAFGYPDGFPICPTTITVTYTATCPDGRAYNCQTVVTCAETILSHSCS